MALTPQDLVNLTARLTLEKEDLRLQAEAEILRLNNVIKDLTPPAEAVEGNPPKES